MDSPERIKMGLGFAPEGRHLFSGLTVEDNLLMGAFQRKNNKSVKEDLDFIYVLFKVLKSYRKKYVCYRKGFNVSSNTTYYR